MRRRSHSGHGLEPRVAPALTVNGRFMVRAGRDIRGVRVAVVAAVRGTWAWQPALAETPMMGLGFLLSGSARVNGDAGLAIQETDILVFSASDPLEVAWDSATVLQLWLEQKWLTDMGLGSSALPAVIRNSALASSVRAFVLRYATAEAASDYLSDFLAERLVIDMAFSTIVTAGTTDETAPPTAASMPRLRSHIAARATDAEFTIETAAQENGLSLRQLQRMFAAEGDTPSRYLRRTRTAMCQHLLEQRATSGLSIEEIARRSGFTSVRAMRRAMRDTEAAGDRSELP